MSTTKTGTSIEFVIPTYNCSEGLRRCLASISGLGKAIVIDMGSTDKTAEIAKQFGAKVFLRRPLDGNFDLNRLWGMRKVKSEWIVKLDSDEELSDALKCELQNFCRFGVPPDINGYYFRNRVYLFGRQINYGVVEKNSRELRLVRNNKWSYNPHRYHQQIIVNGNTGTFRNVYSHYNYSSISEFFKKTNKYTELDSMVLAGEAKVGPIIALGQFVKSFVKFYVLNKGFLDGYLGFVVCLLYSIYFFVEKVKILEKQCQINL